jgi:hypothetical protein
MAVKKSVLKPGDVVQATCVITDKDHKGKVYIHAIVGTLGVVLEDDFNPKFPVIDWRGPGGFGVCNTTPDTFKKYAGKVKCVVD